MTYYYARFDTRSYYCYSKAHLAWLCIQAYSGHWSKKTRAYGRSTRFKGISTMFHARAKHTLMQINIYMFEFKIYQDNMFVCFIPTYTPLLYSKTGVYMGITYIVGTR